MQIIERYKGMFILISILIILFGIADVQKSSDKVSVQQKEERVEEEKVVSDRFIVWPEEPGEPIVDKYEEKRLGTGISSYLPEYVDEYVEGPFPYYYYHYRVDGNRDIYNAHASSERYAGAPETVCMIEDDKAVIRFTSDSRDINYKVAGLYYDIIDDGIALCCDIWMNSPEDTDHSDELYYTIEVPLENKVDSASCRMIDMGLDGKIVFDTLGENRAYVNRKP